MISTILLPLAFACAPTSTAPDALDQAAALKPFEAPAQHSSMAGAAGGLTILETAASTGRFDTLAAAIGAAGLTATLEGPGPFTVFAPTDAAFENVPPHRLNYLLQPENIEALQSLLTFHVAGGVLDASAVLSSPFITTVSGQRAQVDANNLQIEGADIMATDIFCTNGVIHIIDTVIFPELRTVTGLTATNPDFSTLFTALSVAGLDDDLETPGPFTVFAPTNAAFAALQPGVLDNLIANPSALEDVLKFHVTPGRLYAEDVLGAGQLTMLNSLTTNVVLDNGVPKINGVTITVTDIETRNGVVHVIDAVLVPGS